MKVLRLLLTVVCFGIGVAGCERFENILYGDVTQDGYFGYWKLQSYQKKNKPRPISEVQDRQYLETVFEADTITGNPAHSSPGGPYKTFMFFNENLKETSKFMAFINRAVFEKAKNRSLHWYNINNNYGFIVLLDFGKDNTVKSLTMSNIMRSENYNPDYDSLKFVYIPTEKFR